MILKIRATMRLLYIQYVPDLLVVGTQEVFPEKTEWEVSLLKISQSSPEDLKVESGMRSVIQILPHMKMFLFSCSLEYVKLIRGTVDIILLKLLYLYYKK